MSDAMDELFADAENEVVAATVKRGVDHDNLNLEQGTNLEIPDGHSLAYPPGRFNKVKAAVLGSSAKYNADGPTSVKVTIAVLNVKDPGADILRSGPAMVISMSKNEKVKTSTGVQVNSKLIRTDVAPTLHKSSNMFSLTITLAKITHKGLKESCIQDLSPGAEIELSGITFNTSGMAVPWLTCTEFKVTKKAPKEDPRAGVTVAMQTVRSNGASLLWSAALSAVGFRDDAAPTIEMNEGFAMVKSVIDETKSEVASNLVTLFPDTYVKPAEPLKLEESDLQVAPVLLFAKTKVVAPGGGSKGVLFNDAKYAILLRKTNESQKLSELFHGGAVVSTEFGPERSYMNSKLSGEIHVLSTKVLFVPNISLLTGASPYSLKNVLTLTGPTIKAPLAMFAAPFGVNERTTAELLMNYLIPQANMLIAPGKAKIYTRKYDEPDYTQDVYIETQNQVTIDVLTTFRNAALCLSKETVVNLFEGASHSVTVSISGESLIDMIETDHKPTVSTLAIGGVVSLRETAVYLHDETLEFFAVVPDGAKIAQANGNLSCGTDPDVGDKAFLETGGGDVSTCASMLKKGEIGVFAVRVRAKKHSVAHEMASSSAASEQGDGDEEQGDELEEPATKKAKTAGKAKVDKKKK